MADSKLSALTAATIANGTDEIYLNEAGVSKKITVIDFFGNLTDPIVTSSTISSVGAAFTGNVSLSFNELQQPLLLNYAEKINNIGTINGDGATTETIDVDQGQLITATIATGGVPLAFSVPPTSESFSFTLILTNGGSQTVTWPASVIWNAGTAPTLTVAGIDVLTFFTFDTGTTWYGFISGQDMT